MERIAGGRSILIATPAEAAALDQHIRSSADAACAALSDLLSAGQPLEVFRAMKFRLTGFDPLDPSQSRNFLEQVHQTFAYLTAVRGVEYLFANHAQHAPFRINLGTSSTPDITSADGEVAAEVVAVVTSHDNNKLRSDVERMRANQAGLRFVFYYADAAGEMVTDPEVALVRIDL